jgi:hypothetical protein
MSLALIRVHAGFREEAESRNVPTCFTMAWTRIR